MLIVYFVRQYLGSMLYLKLDAKIYCSIVPRLFSVLHLIRKVVYFIQVLFFVLSIIGDARRHDNDDCQSVICSICI